MRSGRERVRRSWKQARRSLGGVRKALTVDAVVEAAGVAKGTFYYHFQSIGELAAAVGAGLGQSFDELLTPARLKLRDPIERFSFAFTKFLEKVSSDADWARLVVQSSQSPDEFGLGVRANLPDGHRRSDCPGPGDRARRRAGSRHCDRHMAAGDARLTRARRPTGIDQPSAPRDASSSRPRSALTGSGP